MSTQDDFRDERPQKQGMSSTAKVLVVLGSIAGVCLLACCGGGIFLYMKAKDAIQNFAQNFTTTNPAEIRDRTADIVHIDIPEEYPPIRAFDFFVMKQIIYGKEQGGSPGAMVMIMHIDQPVPRGQGPAAAKQQRDQILRQMREQQKGQQGGNINTDLTEQSSETREFTINGEKVPFEFIKGTAANGGTPMRQVVGVFPGRSGMVMVMVMVPESEYNEEAIVKMIESIRLPADDDTADSMEDDEAMPVERPAGVTETPAEDKGNESDTSPESSP
jgi:hypothetical protein